MPNQYHLWRKYPSAPFRRYACTLQLAATSAGYEVLEHDPAVADVGFLHTVADHLRRPRQDMTRSEAGLTVRHLRPGNAKHFNAAIRTVPNAVLCSGRTK